MMTAITRRNDFVFLFDVVNGNPNGDPDAGNLPRLDPETNQGLVTDVCLKRKIRNFAEFAKAGEPGFAIYVQEGSALNDKHRQAYKAVRPDDPKVAKRDVKLNPKDDAEAARLRDFMCKNFFDVRAFGAVMSTGVNCGQVRGPVQLAFARSVEPIVPLEISITRMASANEVERKKRDEDSDDDPRTENRTMGRKHIVPFSGTRSPTCSSTTALRRAAKWRRASSSCSSTTTPSAARTRTISSSAFTSSVAPATRSALSATSVSTTRRRRAASPTIG
jgi:CRISPR-associated protein Csd2